MNDPLLAPVPPPPHLLNSWREALSIDRRALDRSRHRHAGGRARRGASRRALAAALPSINATGSVTHQILYDPAPQFAPFLNRTAVQGQLSASLPILAPRPGTPSRRPT